MLIFNLTAFLFAVAMQVSATGRSQSVTLDLRNAPLQKVFLEVSRQTGVSIIYKEGMFAAIPPVTIIVKNASLKEVLDKCLLDKPFTYSIQENMIVVHTKSVTNINHIISAAISVQGTVLDEKGSPLGGVNVLLKGSSVGTTTDASGKFKLNISDEQGGGTLVFSYIGYLVKEVAIGGRNTIDAQLSPDQTAMGEIVVVGYGEQSKSLVTGSISSIKEKEIASVSSTRVEQALQGRTAGVNVLPASGSPGSNVRIRIRGAGSNGNAEPLYIVDGMRAASIDYLDPSEIASIEVLKDAASAAIYGAEGANGVVLIATKTGKRNSSTVISYSGQYTVQSIGKNMKMMDVQQYADYMKDAQVPGSPTDAEVAAVNGKGTDWVDVLFKPVPMQRHSLNISGGSEKSSYLVGGSVFTQQGIVGGDKAQFNRYTLRLNSDHQIKPWLQIGNRLSYSHVNRTGIEEDNEFGAVIFNSMILDPVTPVRYTDGLPPHVQNAIDNGFNPVQDENGNYYGVSKYVKSEASNPLSKIAVTHDRTIQNKVVGNIFLNIEPIKGLKFTTRYGIDAGFQRNHNWNPTWWLTDEQYNTITDVSDRNEEQFTWQWENFANYQKKINNHSFSVLAGVSALSRSNNTLSGSSIGMFREDDNFAYQDFTSDNLDRINGYQVKSSLSSYYGRLSYDYDGRYLLNASIRRDGSSLLPPSSQWGTFPAISLGWVISREKFFNLSAINYLKLRGSWGQNGSLSNLTVGQWASTITSQNLRYQNSNGEYLIAAEPAVLPNYNLKWETSEQLDLGIDLVLLNNRVTLTADYFNKTTKDLLTPGTPPSFVGFSLPTVNGGDVSNKGFELELTYRNDKSSALQYELSGNFTAIKNEVTYLDPKYPLIGGVGVGTGWTATAFEVGYPVWYFRGYKTDGIFQSQEQITDYISKNNLTGYAPSPGEPIVVDVNKDGIISPNDQAFMGSPHPRFMYGGRAALNFKGFDLLLFVQGQVGNEVLMGFNRLDMPAANKPAFFYNDRWTGPGSSNSWFAPNTTNSYIYNSDKMIFSGSYMRIRQLQIGYTLSDKLIERWKAKSLRVYISLDDYFTFTKYPGLDPEAGSNSQDGLGIDRGLYPVPRKLLAGVSFSF